MVGPTMLVGICLEKFMVCKGYESKDLGFRMLSKEFTIMRMPYAKSILICQGRLLLIFKCSLLWMSLTDLLQN